MIRSLTPSACAMFLTLPLLGLALPACKPACPAGFSQTSSGICLRNQFGTPHGTTDGLTTDDSGGGNGGNGGSGNDAPSCAFDTSRVETDSTGAGFIAVYLTCTDPQNDIVGGNVHVLLDSVTNTDDPIVAATGSDSGSSADPDWANAYLDGQTLAFWLQNVASGGHSAAITVADGAGNFGAPLQVTVGNP